MLFLLASEAKFQSDVFFSFFRRVTLRRSAEPDQGRKKNRDDDARTKQERKKEELEEEEKEDEREKEIAPSK